MDDKKYTSEFDENLDDPFAEKKQDNNDTFSEFNFTDDFPEEFASTKPREETDPFAQPAQEYDDDMFANPTQSYDQDPFAAKHDEDPFAQKYDEDPFAQKYNPASDFDDDLFASKDTFKDSFGTNKLSTESELPPPEEPQTPAKRNWFARHPFISIGFLVVLAFGGYRLMTSIGGGEIVPVTPMQNQKSVPAPVANALPPEQVKQIDERLGNLEQSIKAIGEQLKTIEGTGPRLAQLEQNINRITAQEEAVAQTLQRLETLNKQVTALTMLNERLNSLDAQMKAVTADVDLQVKVSEQTQRAANLSRQALQAKSQAPIPMVVQAAIPGRAWLLSEMGELITVARGDEVPGYGRVMNIDPVAGTVTMSSDTVFREQ